jgi:hypothetical protein
MTDEEVDKLRALLADGRTAGPCPPAELLARVAAGEASSSDRDRVVDHLVDCAACGEEYRVASSLMPWADQADGFVDTPSERPWLGRSSTTVGYAAAAALLVAVSVGLLAWALSLRNENARLAAALGDRAPIVSPREEATVRDRTEVGALQAKLNEALAPALNVPIIDLLPIDAVRGSGSQSVPRVPSAARLVTFVMTTASVPAAAAHELEIVDPTGTVVWRGTGLRPNSERAFTVTMPRSWFAPGTSRVRLYAAGKLVAEYSVAVEP